MRAHRFTSAIGCASLGCALAACSPATPAGITIERATATLHKTTEGWVVDGEFDLVVEAFDDTTETWLMSVSLASSRSSWDAPLTGVLAEPISTFPLRATASSPAVGAARFHALYFTSASPPAGCPSSAQLWVGCKVYDTSSLDRPRHSQEPDGTMWIDYAEADLTCEPAP